MHLKILLTWEEEYVAQRRSKHRSPVPARLKSARARVEVEALITHMKNRADSWAHSQNVQRFSWFPVSSVSTHRRPWTNTSKRSRRYLTNFANSSLLRLLLRGGHRGRELALRLVPNRVGRLLREVVELDEARRRVLVEGAEVSVEGGHGRVEQAVRGRRGRDKD